MTHLQDIISNAAGQFGVGEDKLSAATAGLLNMIRDEADGGADLVSALPGNETIMAAASAAGGGGIIGMAGKLLGGNLGQGLNLASLLRGSGLSNDDAGQYAGTLMDFARGHAGQALVDRVLGSLPQLAKLIR